VNRRTEKNHSLKTSLSATDRNILVFHIHVGVQLCNIITPVFHVHVGVQLCNIGTYVFHLDDVVYFMTYQDLFFVYICEALFFEYKFVQGLSIDELCSYLNPVVLNFTSVF